jgi:hypothetical protein
VDTDFWDYLGEYLMSEQHETERFLTDFSRAWGPVVTNDTNPANNGVRDYIPQHVREEQVAYERQQKQTATTVTIGNGPTYISASEGSDRLQLHGGTGYIPIRVDEIDEVIAALQRLRTLLQPAATPTSGKQRSTRVYEQRPNHPGWMSQAEKNDIALKKALGIDY